LQCSASSSLMFTNTSYRFSREEIKIINEKLDCFKILEVMEQTQQIQNSSGCWTRWQAVPIVGLLVFGTLEVWNSSEENDIGSVKLQILCLEWTYL
jgi:hypothetical protein